MRQNKHYLFDMNYLEIFGVQADVGVDVLKIFGVAAEVLKPETRAKSESEKCNSAHLCCEHLQHRWRYSKVLEGLWPVNQTQPNWKCELEMWFTQHRCPGLWSRKDFQLDESESQKILTAPTPCSPFARRLWLFVPQTYISITLGN